MHNDLKPGNLFLNAQGDALVADFGFAVLVPPGATTAQPPGATPETAAPEIAARWNTPATTASIVSDVYSLGATAYWLLSSRPPHDFTGAATVDAKMAIVAAQAPPRLRDLAPHVPQGVAAVIEKAMERTLTNRFSTVTNFAATLGTRRAPSRRWRRTDEHPGHLACWRGEPEGRGGTYVVCLEQGARPSQRLITTRHAASGDRVTKGCRVAAARNWPQAVRSVIRELS